jgi:hypothetical protein
MRNHMKRLTLLLALCVIAMTASPAFAQTGTDGYQTGGEKAAGQVGGGNGPTNGEVTAGAVAGSDSGGSLPFTGLDVALLLAVGGVLVVVGLGTRRLTRHSAA